MTIVLIIIALMLAYHIVSLERRDLNALRGLSAIIAQLDALNRRMSEGTDEVADEIGSISRKLGRIEKA